MKEMSDLSLKEWNRLLTQAMSPSEAISYLYNVLPSRSFRETLQKLHPAPGLRPRLTDVLISSGASRESADRTARNWLSGASAPKDRLLLYRVALELSLSADQCNRLLASVFDYGIHARDPKEVVYLFALRTGRGYADAQRLSLACAAIYTERGGGAESTRMLDEQIGELNTDEQFIAWYRQHMDSFSEQHETAHQMFMDYLKYLTEDQGVANFSIEYIANTCLRFQDKVPLDRSREHMDGVQRVIKHYWPNATAIKQMKERKAEVSRKALILLYILCEGIASDDTYSELDEEYVSAAERLEAHALSLDAMLETCGMGTLDPRGVFDWLVLYCLSHDADDGMSERMEEVMSCLFPLESDSTEE